MYSFQTTHFFENIKFVKRAKGVIRYQKLIEMAFLKKAVLDFKLF